MQGIILLNSNENTWKVEEEERGKFVYSILQECGLPIQDIWQEGKELSVEDKIKLNSLLLSYEIQVIDSFDGEVEIYLKNELIAEWRKCKYVLKKDPTQINPRKKFYYEMHIECNSVFEKNE